MIENRPHWLSKPTKRHILLIGLLWLSGLVSSLMYTTDNFKESPFLLKNMIFFMIQAAATWVYFSMIKNYYLKHKRN